MCLQLLVTDLVIYFQLYTTLLMESLLVVLSMVVLTTCKSYQWNNSFKLKASPDAVGFVNLSSVGTTTVHSFTPAKSGIIVTKTVDTKIPQEDWSIDPCDGTGVTGYNLDLSRIQMAYIDYSWYGAGKIRFGLRLQMVRFNMFTSLSTTTTCLSHTFALVTFQLAMK
jgi:hypothetical protein